MEKTKAENPALYAWEGLACLSVVLIHCMLPGRVGVLAGALARFAVPLFFLVSGYYLRREGQTAEEVHQRLGQKLHRLGWVLAEAVLFYLGWTLLRAFHSGGVEAVQQLGRTLIQPRQLFATLVLNDFTPIGGHLWFLAALLACYALLHRFGCGMLDTAGGWAVALLGIHVAGRGVCALLQVEQLGGVAVYLWFRNWAFFALPFLALGDWTRRHQAELLQRLDVTHLRICFGAGVVLTAVQALAIDRLNGDDRELYLGTFLLVGAIFLGALRQPDRLRCRSLASLGKHDLQTVYLVHLWLIDLVGMVLARVSLPGAGWMKPFAVMALSVGCGALWRRICAGRRRPDDGNAVYRDAGL